MSLSRASTFGHGKGQADHPEEPLHRSPVDVAREQFYGADAVADAKKGPTLVFSYASPQAIKQARLEALQLKMQERLKANMPSPPIDPYQGLETHDSKSEDQAGFNSAESGRMRAGGAEQYQMLVVPPETSTRGDEKLSTARLVENGRISDYQRNSGRPMGPANKAATVSYNMLSEDNHSTAGSRHQRRSSAGDAPGNGKQKKRQASPDKAKAVAEKAEKASQRASESDSCIAPKKERKPADPRMATLRHSVATPYVPINLGSSLVPIKGLGTTAQVVDAVRSSLEGAVMRPFLTSSPATAAQRNLQSGEDASPLGAGMVRSSYTGGQDLGSHRASDGGNHKEDKSSVMLVKVQEEDLLALYRKQSAQKLLSMAGLTRAPSFRFTRSASAGPRRIQPSDTDPFKPTAAPPKDTPATRRAAAQLAKEAVEATSQAAVASLLLALTPPEAATVPGFGAEGEERTEGEEAGGSPRSPRSPRTPRSPRVQGMGGVPASGPTAGTVPSASHSAAPESVAQTPRGLAQDEPITPRQPSQMQPQPQQQPDMLQPEQQAMASTPKLSTIEDASDTHHMQPTVPLDIASTPTSASVAPSPRGDRPRTALPSARLSTSTGAVDDVQSPVQASLLPGSFKFQPSTSPTQQQLHPQQPAASTSTQRPVATPVYGTVHQPSTTSLPVPQWPGPANTYRSTAAMYSPAWQPPALPTSPTPNLYRWQTTGPRHRPRPFSGLSSQRSMSMSASHSSMTDAPSSPNGASTPSRPLSAGRGRAGQGFTFTINGVGLSQAKANKLPAEEKVSPRPVQQQTRLLQASDVALSVPTRKTMSRSRNGLLAWKDVPETEDPASLGPWDNSAAPLNPGSAATQPVPVAIRPHSATSHPTPTPSTSTPLNASASSTRPASARPASAAFHHTTLSVSQIEADALTTARSDLQYRVLEQQAAQRGMASPQELIESQAAAAQETITTTPVVAHLYIPIQSPPSQQHQHSPHRPATAPVSRTPIPQGGSATPAVRALSAVSAHSTTLVTARPITSLSLPRPASAVGNRLGGANGGEAKLSRPQSALPLNTSGVAVKRTRPPSGGCWAGAPVLSTFVAESLENDEVELVWSASTQALENVPGVCMASLTQYPVLAAPVPGL